MPEMGAAKIILIRGQFWYDINAFENIRGGLNAVWTDAETVAEGKWGGMRARKDWRMGPGVLLQELQLRKKTPTRWWVLENYC